MAKIIRFSLPYDQDLGQYLAEKYPEIKNYRILSRSLDARRAVQGRTPLHHYVLEQGQGGESSTGERFFTDKKFHRPPIIIGQGPAGLFCALRFAEYQIPTIILERGAPVGERMRRIARFWRYGQLNQDTNVCFGEGGAGLFSDGKLLTRIKSPLVSYVMKKFVDYGAPEEVAYVSNPHLGSHRIRKIISAIAQHLTDCGHRLGYHNKVCELIVEKKTAQSQVRGVVLESGEKIYSDHVILATGHSAREFYHYCKDQDIAMSLRPFSVGVRVEHPRQAIDGMQYGSFQSEEKLGAARYRLSWVDPLTKRGIFSFCMCPGGYVLSCATEGDGMVTNGMSNYACNSPWSNSAFVVQVSAGQDFAADHVLAGMNYQREIEQKAWQCSRHKATGRELPAMYMSEFLQGKLTPRPLPVHSSPSGLFKQDLRAILPPAIVDHLVRALGEFGHFIPGFSCHEQAIVIAPETRTSAPVTIERDPHTLVSRSHGGLYPCGEGAGYAGGITSAAVDGVRVCEAILRFG